MEVEKNILEVINNILINLQKKPYYFTSIKELNLEFKEIDELWDYFKTTSLDYQSKYKINENIQINDNLKEIFDKKNIFKTIFSLHTLTDKPHIVTFNIKNDENVLILYKTNNDKLPSKFISLTMPNPIENIDFEDDKNLIISCFFED